MTAPARPSGPPPLTPQQTDLLEKVVGQLVLNISPVGSNFKSRGPAAESDLKKVLKKDKTNMYAVVLLPLLKPLLTSAQRAEAAAKLAFKSFQSFEKKQLPYVKLKAEIEKADREAQAVIVYADAYFKKGGLTKSFGVGHASILAMCELFPKQAKITSALIDKLPRQ